MRERIKNRQITKEIRGQLPVITPAMFRERGCSYCPYYLELKTAYELLMSMFEAEMAQEELEKDECYDCCYAKCGPCIGLCYKTLKG